LDRDHETFTAFGVTSRPATIVIDPRGKVALVTQPMDLTAKALIGISNGEKTASMMSDPSKGASSARPATDRAVAEKKVDAPVLDAPLAGVSLRRKLPNERAFTFEHDTEGKQAYIGFDAKVLVGMALAVPDRRVSYIDELPSGNYDLTLNLGTVSDAAKSAILTAVVVKAFNLDIRKSDSMQDVLVLKRAADVSLKAQQTFDAGSARGVQQNGAEWAFSNFSMSDLGSQIESKYGIAVVDETGLAGGFDGGIHWPETKDRLDDVLRHDLGLEVTAERRSVPIFSVSKRK
jgi:uncharacterized protein (TIGR03435 family)